MTMERIDPTAPWHHAESYTQREYPGRGRYRVRANFITGKAPNYEYADVSFWLPAENGNDRHVQWLAFREITNSRRHPSEFEGMELPTKR